MNDFSFLIDQYLCNIYRECMRDGSPVNRGHVKASIAVLVEAYETDMPPELSISFICS